MSIFGYTTPKGLSGFRVRTALEFGGGESAESYLHWTPAVNQGDEQTATISLWCRQTRWSTGLTRTMFAAGIGDGDTRTKLYWGTGNQLGLFCAFGAAGSHIFLRATDAHATTDWLHAVARFDMSNATQADRARIYVNNVELALTFNTIPADTTSLVPGLFQAMQHTIGAGFANEYFEGLLADVHAVQGLSLPPSDFGEDIGGIWLPKRYSGSHGLNGMRFRFDDPADVGKNTAVA